VYRLIGRKGTADPEASLETDQDPSTALS
jgi:hypothetical protein